MCGIAGMVRLDGAPVDREALARMNRVQAHRGPDDEGIHVDDEAGVGLGHRRLSILDLSPAGHQPMAYRGRYWITYNGEVYNYLELGDELQGLGHHLASRTDTEVILAAYDQWGPDCLARFNGMWAFAIWDARERTLFCARDRFGVKPFYYYCDSRVLLFASELKAIVGCLRETGLAPVAAADGVVADYLHGLYLDDGEPTFFRGIRRLPASHELTLRDGKVGTRRYYALDPDRVWPESDRAGAVARYGELFADSIRLRLRSDVSVGSCLSGGLDSSSIVCTVSRLIAASGAGPDAPRQKTFSACYEPGSKYDERPFIDAVLGETGAEGHFVFPTGEGLLDDLESLVWHQDEPVGSTSQYAQWCVFRLAQAGGVKVMLDGQGADETISGYHGAYPNYFLDLALGGRWRTLAREIRLRKGYHGYGVLSGLATLGRGVVRRSTPAPLQGLLSARRLRRVRHPFFPIAPAADRDGLAPAAWRRRGALREYLYSMTTGSSLQSLLRYEDRNSMAFSIEARVPFLDYRLVEHAFSLPASLVVHEGMTKVVLREAMRGVLPEKIRARTDKIGFATPEGQWFRTTGRGPIRDLIGSASFRSRGYFDRENIEKAFDTFCGDHSDLPLATLNSFWSMVNPFWRAVNLELWLRTFVDGGRPAPAPAPHPPGLRPIGTKG